MEWWVETMEGGSKALELEEMIGGWVGVGGSQSWTNVSASVGFLLKIIYQHVSTDVMDMVQYD